eukprot:1368301-Prymnesium_polylepis.1
MAAHRAYKEDNMTIPGCRFTTSTTDVRQRAAFASVGVVGGRTRHATPMATQRTPREWFQGVIVFMEFQSRHCK